MKEPKFVPGERVILDSKHFPECNGGAIVLDAKFRYVHGPYYMPVDGWAYFCSVPAPNGMPFCESVLRKLPPNTPSTFEECIFKPEKVNA